MNNINGKSNDLPLPEELFDYFSDDYDSETPTPILKMVKITP